jgi:hypothetical protein
MMPLGLHTRAALDPTRYTNPRPWTFRNFPRTSSEAGMPETPFVETRSLRERLSPWAFATSIAFLLGMAVMLEFHRPPAPELVQTVPTGPGEVTGNDLNCPPEKPGYSKSVIVTAETGANGVLQRVMCKRFLTVTARP